MTAPPAPPARRPWSTPARLRSTCSAAASPAIAPSSPRRPISASPIRTTWTPARAGGRAGEGVRGARSADGALADGHGDGTAASRAALDAGDGGAATWASRTDPYLRALLGKLDRAITFPHALALDLRSGRSIAVMTLHADGRISEITVVTTSGFAGFDDELARALRTLERLGPVPAALLDGRRTLRVMVPYTFKNPLIE